MRVIALAAFSLAAMPALADTCPTDLRLVDASFTETLARLAAAAKAGQTERCAALKHHIDVMTNARDVFLRCLTGHDRDENAGQMQASIDDFRQISASQDCG